MTRISRLALAALALIATCIALLVAPASAQTAPGFRCYGELSTGGTITELQGRFAGSGTQDLSDAAAAAFNVGVGCRQQLLGPMFMGIVARAGWQDIKRTAIDPLGNTATFKQSAPWSIAGQLGTDVGKNWSVYGSLGYAESKFAAAATGLAADDRKGGWLLGAGANYKLTSSVSLMAEYNAELYGSTTLGAGAVKLDPTTHSFRLGALFYVWP